jgi:hypothetical protein
MSLVVPSDARHQQIENTTGYLFFQLGVLSMLGFVAQSNVFADRGQ